MTITEVIAALESLAAEFGDLEVRIGAEPIDLIWYRSDEDDPPHDHWICIETKAQR
jgi:hypothetical protein